MLMDCSICTTMPSFLRPPRNTICAACYDGARSLISLVNKFDADSLSSPNDNKTADDKSNVGNSIVTLSNSSKGFAKVVKWVKEMKEMEEQVNDKVVFLGDIQVAFREQMHTDILVKPGNHHGLPPIPAHRALLAAKSEIFKNMLDSDGCKEAPTDAITLPELDRDELESLLEFLYKGSLPTDKVETHVYALSVAADKYMIPFLQKFCQRHMQTSLCSANVLDVLEISDVCSDTTLKTTALNFIVENKEDIVFSARYEAFALKNAHLSVQITRALLLDLKKVNLII